MATKKHWVYLILKTGISLVNLKQNNTNMKKILIILTSFLLVYCAKKESVTPVASQRVAQESNCMDTTFGNKVVSIKQSLCTDTMANKKSSMDISVNNEFVYRFTILSAVSLLPSSSPFKGGSIYVYPIKNRPIGICGFTLVYNNSKDTLRGVTYFHHRHYVK